MGAHVGVIGMAVMGQNLARNMESRGYTVGVYNRTAEKTRELVEGPGKGKRLVPAWSIEELIRGLSKPRTLLIMVQAGKPVDEVINQAAPLLSRRATSSLTEETRSSRTPSAGPGRRRRKASCSSGHGVSGGEEGALHGPSIMPGRPSGRVELTREDPARHLRKGGRRALLRVYRSDGAGHYVKMVHNGIEYGDMQLISEAYFIMRNLLGMDHQEMAATLRAVEPRETWTPILSRSRRTSSGRKTRRPGFPLWNRSWTRRGRKGHGQMDHPVRAGSRGRRGHHGGGRFCPHHLRA